MMNTKPSLEDESKHRSPEKAISGKTRISSSEDEVSCSKESALRIFSCTSPNLGANWRHPTFMFDCSTDGMWLLSVGEMRLGRDAKSEQDESKG
jgi:hypothetical protein